MFLLLKTAKTKKWRNEQQQQKEQHAHTHFNIMPQMSTCMTACNWLRGGLPGSRRGFVNRERRKAGLGLHSASLPLGEATPPHQREPQEILPTMYRQSSAWCNTHYTCYDTLTGKSWLQSTESYRVNRNSAAASYKCPQPVSVQIINCKVQTWPGGQWQPMTFYSAFIDTHCTKADGEVHVFRINV